MGLSYNTETAVKRDIKTQLYEDTEFLNEQNITGRESDIQTEPYTATFVADGSTTLTFPVVLTGVQLSGMLKGAGGPYSMDLVAYAKGQIAGALYLGTNAGGQNQDSIFIPLPNWNLSAGEVLQGSISFTAGATHDEAINFIGYKA